MEIKSLLKATRTQDGGAVAQFSVQTPQGPARFTATVSPADAAKLQRLACDHLECGLPPKEAAKAAMSGQAPVKPKRGGLFSFGAADPDDLMVPTYKAPKRKGQDPEIMEPTFKNPRRKPTKTEKTVANDAVMGTALRKLHSKTPPKYHQALALAARSAIGDGNEFDDPAYHTNRLAMSATKWTADKGVISLRPSKTAVGDKIPMGRGLTFVDDEDHNSLDELSQWIAPPLGVPESNEPAAILSGEHLGARLLMEGDDGDLIREAKTAIISRFQKTAPGVLKALRYEGAEDDKMKFKVRTAEGKEKQLGAKQVPGGWLISSMGDDSIVAPEEIKEAKTLLVGRLLKNREPVRAIKYEGKSPVTGRHKFMVMLRQGQKAFEAAKSPSGWMITTVSGHNVGAFGFLKKAVKGAGKGLSAAAKGVRKGVKATVKAGKGIGKLVGSGFASALGRLGGLVGIKAKMAALKKKKTHELAVRAANFEVWKKTKGKVRKAPASVVNAKMAWASKIINSAQVNKKANQTFNKLAATIKGTKVSGADVVGSFGRYDVLAASDNTPSIPSVEGWTEVGIMWSNMWNPFYWLELAIRGAMSKPEVRVLAPEELPEGEPEEGAVDEASPEGGEESYESPEASSEEASESEESEVEGDVQGPFHNRSALYKKILLALKTAGVPIGPRARWPKDVWIKAKKIAQAIAGPRMGRRKLIQISRNNQIMVQHGDGRWRVGRHGPGGTSLGKAEARRTVSTVNTVLEALRRANLPLTPPSGKIHPRWTNVQFQKANQVAVAALKAKKIPDYTNIARNRVKVLIRNKKILVKSKTPNTTEWFEIKSGTAFTKWTGNLPANFLEKKNVVRNLFLKLRANQESVAQSQGITYSNKFRVNQLALEALRKVGLPVLLLKFDPTTGELLPEPGTETTASSGIGYDEFKDLRLDFIEDGLKDKRDYPAEEMFDPALWIDQSDVEPEADKLEQEEEEADDVYSDDEGRLWMRPALAGDFVGVATTSGNLSKLWWKPLSFFQTRRDQILQTIPVSIAAVPQAGGGGGGGGGGPSGGGGGGGEGEGGEGEGGEEEAPAEGDEQPDEGEE